MIASMSVSKGFWCALVGVDRSDVLVVTRPFFSAEGERSSDAKVSLDCVAMRRFGVVSTVNPSLLAPCWGVKEDMVAGSSG